MREAPEPRVKCQSRVEARQSAAGRPRVIAPQGREDALCGPGKGNESANGSSGHKLRDARVERCQTYANMSPGCVAP